jgi:hypothetical protein
VKEIVVENKASVDNVTQRVKSLRMARPRVVAEEPDTNFINSSIISGKTPSKTPTGGHDGRLRQINSHYLKSLSILSSPSGSYRTTDSTICPTEGKIEERDDGLHGDTQCSVTGKETIFDANEQADLNLNRGGKSDFETGLAIDNSTSEFWADDWSVTGEQQADSNASVIGLVPSSIYSKARREAKRSHAPMRPTAISTGSEMGSDDGDTWTNILHRPGCIPESIGSSAFERRAESPAYPKGEKEQLLSDVDETQSVCSSGSTRVLSRRGSFCLDPDFQPPSDGEDPSSQDEAPSRTPIVHVYWHRSDLRGASYPGLHFQMPLGRTAPEKAVLDASVPFIPSRCPDPPEEVFDSWTAGSESLEDD